MFAIAVWDTQRRELSLVRDRLGKKPLYVYREPGLVTFGSELKALVAGPSFDRSIDRDRARVVSPVPVRAGAEEHLPARDQGAGRAHPDRVRSRRSRCPRPQPYWSLREVARRRPGAPVPGHGREAVDELDALLVGCGRAAGCSRTFRSARSCPGGIDSSTVVALMQEASSRPVKTYTIGFAEEEFDEARHAARVAQHLGTDHTELLLTGDDAHALIPRLPDIFDEPLANPSQLPTLLVSQLARRHVTVALCGDGGDELFGGYNRYVYGTRMLPRVNRIPRAVRQPVGAGPRQRAGGGLGPAAPADAAVAPRRAAPARRRAGPQAGRRS